MSSDTPQNGDALVAEGLGKCYRIYEKPSHRLWQTVAGKRRKLYREFWALRNVSFTLPRGDAIGIVGRNGAGKSTLLQILAGTLAPSEGRAVVNGRVTALLELSSGFNPEFTGRENVFMQGAIVGFSPARIRDLFDEIVDFSGIVDFIDQPVKFYSSGMFVRLAFAVQAFLEPDVLIVDEALSVGDVQFQHKCMRRIKQLMDAGTSLLFVSHSTDVVKRFCRHGLWLENGEVRYLGEAGVAAEKYLAFTRMREASPRATDALQAGDRAPREPSPSDLLPVAAGDIDLSDDCLFLRGTWDAVPGRSPDSVARKTADPRAAAGFRYTGGEVQLTFGRSPQAGVVRITVDGQERLCDLYHAEGEAVHTVNIATERGEHVIGIEPGSTPAHGGALLWLAARVVDNAPLTFRRDAALGLQAGKVERYGSGKGRITAVELLDFETGEPVEQVGWGQRVRLRIHAERLEAAGPRVEFSYIVRDLNRIDIFGTTTAEEGVYINPDADRYVVDFAFNVRLGPGSYAILVSFVECSEDLNQRLPMDQLDIAKVFAVAFSPSRPVWYIYGEPVTVTATVLKDGAEADACSGCVENGGS